MMPDLPHTSAPMVMHGRALALKNTCRNASSTSVEKHLSWSPDMHPTARWVPSTPHRSRPAGHPPNRQPCAVGAEEREYDEGCDVEADGERRRPQSAARRRRSVGQLRRPTPRRRQAATEGLPRHRLPRRHTPAAAEMRQQQDGRRRGRPPSAAHHRRRAGQLRQPAYRRRRATAEGRPNRPLPRRHRTPAPAPAPTTTGCAGSRIACRKHTAPPPSRCSKDVTAHPHRPGDRPGRPCPAPVRSGRNCPAKAGSGPHYGTEFQLFTRTNDLTKSCSCAHPSCTPCMVLAPVITIFPEKNRRRTIGMSVGRYMRPGNMLG